MSVSIKGWKGIFSVKNAIDKGSTGAPKAAEKKKTVPPVIAAKMAEKKKTVPPVIAAKSATAPTLPDVRNQIKSIIIEKAEIELRRDQDWHHGFGYTTVDTRFRREREDWERSDTIDRFKRSYAIEHLSDLLIVAQKHKTFKEIKAVAKDAGLSVNIQQAKLSSIENIKAKTGGDENGWAYRILMDYYTGFIDLDPARLAAIELIYASCVSTKSIDKNHIEITPYPKEIKRDDEGRIHCADELAVTDGEGGGLYVWQGNQVPEKWVKYPNTVTAEEIMSASNTDLRTAALDIIGWDAILETCYWRVIDKDEDPMIGELLDIVIEDPKVAEAIEKKLKLNAQKLDRNDVFLGKRQRILRAKCGTGRTVVVPVPNTMKTALEANANSYGFDVKDFMKPEVRT